MHADRPHCRVGVIEGNRQSLQEREILGPMRLKAHLRFGAERQEITPSIKIGGGFLLALNTEVSAALHFDERFTTSIGSYQESVTDEVFSTRPATGH